MKRCDEVVPLLGPLLDAHDVVITKEAPNYWVER